MTRKIKTGQNKNFLIILLSSTLILFFIYFILNQNYIYKNITNNYTVAIPRDWQVSYSGSKSPADEYTEMVDIYSLKSVDVPPDGVITISNLKTKKLTSDGNTVITKVKINGNEFEKYEDTSKEGFKSVWMLGKNMRGDNIAIFYRYKSSKTKSDIDNLINSFKFINKKYSCPKNGWADCTSTQSDTYEQCQLGELEWYETNCSNFKGGAY